MEEETRVCTKCGIEKPVSQFYKNTSHGKSLFKACKICERARQKIRDEENFFDAIHRVYNEPGKYSSELQRQATFDILKALGWSFNEEKNLWYKTPLKDKNGNWALIYSKQKKQRKSRASLEYDIIKKKKEVAIRPADYQPSTYYRTTSLTPEQKDELREEYQKPHMTIKKLMEKYGISQSYVSNIINYKV